MKIYNTYYIYIFLSFSCTVYHDFILSIIHLYHKIDQIVYKHLVRHLIRHIMHHTLCIVYTSKSQNKNIEIIIITLVYPTIKKICKVHITDIFLFSFVVELIAH